MSLLLTKNGRLVVRDGLLVTVESGAAGDCECCVAPPDINVCQDFYDLMEPGGPGRSHTWYMNAAHLFGTDLYCSEFAIATTGIPWIAVSGSPPYIHTYQRSVVRLHTGPGNGNLTTYFGITLQCLTSGGPPRIRIEAGMEAQETSTPRSRYQGAVVEILLPTYASIIFGDHSATATGVASPFCPTPATTTLSWGPG